MSTEDERRIAALHEYEIMDTPPEQVYDDISLLTSFICGTPIALITLLDMDRQWFKSRIGVTRTETSIEHAFCAHAIRQKEIFLVPDASQDERFANNPFVLDEPHIRFYAGAPLITPQGVGVGTLCAIDREPRTFTREQHNALEALARQVITALELRRTVNALTRTIQEKAIAEQKADRMTDLLPMCSWCHKVRDDHNYWKGVEDFLAEQMSVEYSHGICPDCADKQREQRLARKGSWIQAVAAADAAQSSDGDASS